MRKAIYFDLRAKLALLFLTSVAVIIVKEVTSLFIIIVFLSVYLGIQGKYKAAVLYPIIALASRLLIQITAYLGFSFFIAWIVISIPMLIIGYSISMVTPTEIIATLYKMKCPRIVSIMVTIIFRFMPTIRHEFSQIRDAQKLRGITSITRPMECFEYTLIPMMMRCAKVSEELSIAAEVRGIEYPGRHTSRRNIKMHAKDYVLLLVSILAYTAVILLEKGGFIS